MKRDTTKKKKAGGRKGKGKGKMLVVVPQDFVGVVTFKELKRVFGVCEVACLDRGKRLWIVPVVKEDTPGFSVLRTAYIGDPSPRTIGFAPTAEMAREYLSQHSGIPLASWKKCPVFSMMNPMRELV